MFSLPMNLLSREISTAVFFTVFNFLVIYLRDQTSYRILIKTRTYTIVKERLGRDYSLS